MRILKYIKLCTVFVILSGCMVGIEPISVDIPSTNLGALPGNAKSYVTWNSIENVSDYRLYKTAQIDPVILNGIDINNIQTLSEFAALFESLGVSYDSVDVAELSFVDDGLTNGQAYCYAVAGLFGGQGPISNTDCAIPVGVAVPSTLAQSLFVTVVWDAVEGAESYNLYWQSILPDISSNVSKAEVPLSDYELIANVEDTGAPQYVYEHPDRSNCTDDYYIIKPVNVLGQEGQDVQDAVGLPRTIGVFNEDFGDNGIVMRTDREGEFSDIDFLSDGSIVALFNGRVLEPNRLYKFTHDGDYIKDVNINADLANDVAALTVDENDNVYAVSNNQMNACKYDSDLEKATDFGVSGCFKSGVFDSYGFDIVLDSVGRVLVTGRGDALSIDALTVWRLTADGELDTSFGSGGVYTYPTSGPPTTEGQGISVVDGTIYVVGYYMMAFPPQFLILALNESDGSYIGEDIDAGMGSQTAGTDIALNTDGTLLVSGATNVPLYMYLWNYDTDLSLIRTQGYHHPSGVGVVYDAGMSVIVDCIGKPVVAGYSGDPVSSDFAVIRANADLTLDIFGNQDPVDGWFVYDEANERDIAFRVIEDDRGRLYVSGNLRDPTTRPAIIGLK